MRTNSHQFNVGVIGTGGMGTRHAHNLHAKVVGTRVAAVSDVDVGRAEQVAAACGSAHVFADPYHLIADSRIEAILIASPDETHADLVLACLRHHKSVLCEKPLATNAADASKIVEAELALGRRLVSVGFMRRFDPQHVGVKQVVESGAIGRPILFKGVHRNPSVPSDFPGELVFSGSAIHDIDSVRWLLGQEIEEVYVRGVRTDPSLNDDVRDLLLIQLTLTGHCLASIEVYLTAEYGYEVSAEVVAERGTAVTAQPDQAVVRFNRSRLRSVPGDWLERFQVAYVTELENWVKSASSGHFTGADAWDGYVSLLASDACLKSLRSGQPERVPVPAKPALYTSD